jgi:hypothetical protein
MQALPPATTNAPLLRAKPWRWALLSAALSLGVSAACPGVAEAGVLAKKAARPIFNSPPATIGFSTSQLSANLQIDPVNAAQSPSKSGKIKVSSIANSVTSSPGKNNKQGKGKNAKSLASFKDWTPATLITEVKVLAYSKNGTASINPANGEISSAPGPLPLLGAGVAFAYSRKVRRRVSQATSEELIPAFARS